MMIRQKAWCKKHPTGYLGKDQFGHWYEKCWTGKKHPTGYLPKDRDWETV